MENNTNEVEAKKPVKKKSEKQTKQYKEFVKNTVEINPELNEQVEKTVVLGWGRMNPITVGHEKLVNKIKSVAKQNSATPVLYLTHSQDPKKNPLSYNDKVMLAKRAFGNMVQKTNAKTIMQALAELDKTYDKVILVVGSDRVKEFDTLLKKYNGKDYEFSNISVVSAGDRDPDADDVSGMSASKMRALAASGKPEEFKKGLPRKLQGMADKVYDMVRSGMKLAEELESEGLLLDEALNMQQRLKRSRIMKRYASKIKAARQRKMRRKASQEQLKSRARKKAINIIRKKVAGAQGRDYGEMSVGEKIMIDKKVEKRKAAIDRIAKKLLPKVRKAELVRLRGGSGKINEEFEKLFEKPEVKQDPDVKDMPGTQPKSYYKGVKKSVKDDRARHFKRYAKKSDDDPASYKPAPGDKGAKTKESEHTKKYRQMYGEQINLGDEPKPKKKFHQMMKANGSPKLDKRFKINRKQYQEAVDASNPRVKALKDRQTGEKNRLRSTHEIEMDRLKVNLIRSKTSSSNKKINEDIDILKLVDEIHESLQLDEKKQMEGLKKKSEKSGISYGILKKVFDRGVAAWRTGHRPGTTPSQWGYARVNSFITGGKTRTTADKDLWARHSGKKEEVEYSLDEAFENFLNEGVNDPSIFKAVFLAGGPGSGKSFIVGKTALPALGFKVINSDQAFEAALAKAGMEATPENIYSPKGQELRTGAKALTKKKLDLALAGRLGLVIDGTGKDYDKIVKQAINLRKLGYDVAMIFVNTDEDTALERNRKRSRSLPDDTVSKMWKDVQKNLGSFQSFFGNFFLVDNSEGSDFNRQSTDVYKKLSAWAKRTPKNKAVNDWMKSQRVNEEHGAGFRGTSDLADRYAKDTPGQEPMKTHKNKYKEPKAKNYNEEFESLFKGTEE